MGKSVRHKIYFCQETERHMDISKRSLKVDCECMYECIRRKLAGMITLTPKVPSTSSQSVDSSSPARATALGVGS